MAFTAISPINDPRDLAYRLPLEDSAKFPCPGEVNHPNLKETLYASMEANQLVADIGCGPEPFEYDSFPVRFLAFDTFEPDSREGMKPNDSFRLGQLERFPLENNSCDAVILGFILEHVADPAVFIKEANRVLKSGGYCYIAVPNYRSLEDRLFRLATTVAGSSRGPHIQKFTFENLQQMVTANSELFPLTWHHLGGSFLWMMHPKLKAFRPAMVTFLKLLRKLGIDLIKGSNIQIIFQKQ